MRIKTVRVTNKNNVVIQVPGFIVKKWNLTESDFVEVHISDDEETVVLKPRKGFRAVSLGSGLNQEG